VCLGVEFVASKEDEDAIAPGARREGDGFDVEGSALPSGRIDVIEWESREARGECIGEMRGNGSLGDRSNGGGKALEIGNPGSTLESKQSPGLQGQSYPSVGGFDLEGGRPIELSSHLGTCRPADGQLEGGATLQRSAHVETAATRVGIGANRECRGLGVEFDAKIRPSGETERIERFDRLAKPPFDDGVGDAFERVDLEAESDVGARVVR
jgi:hypothetical protein